MIYLTALVIIFLGFLLRYPRQLYIGLSTLPRDIQGIFVYLKVNLFSIYCLKTNQNAAKYFDQQVKKRRGKPCFFFENETWTYEMVQDLSFKVARYFKELGYKKKDTVALMMENRPEYVCIWLGLSRIGVISSLINFNIRLKSLEHCIAVANCKALIFGTELTPVIQELIDSGGASSLQLISFDDRTPVSKRLSKPHIDLTEALKSVSASPLPASILGDEDMSKNDTLVNIYTSGTTGLPKAVIIKQSRVFALSTACIAAGLKSDRDVLITPVPLYHVQGGVLGVCAAIFHGVPQVIVRKFSASRFWNECIKYDVTASQYLGEIIRYLYNQPEKPEDKLHKVHTFFGNGVNPAIWEKFIQRFNNVKIKEIYGATEGNCNTMNIEGHVGACGYFPLYYYRFMPLYLAKVDEVTGEVIRDPKTGLVMHADIGQPGELMGKITQSNPFREFSGYTDPESTKKKLIQNVKSKGDEWFRTGDLIVMDEYGYWYFKDRSGDTFRWKGENVSTAEVEEVVTRGAGMKGCVVYGVQVPGNEGRCGMAAISDPEGNLNLIQLASEVNLRLPSYARPLFVRVINQEMNMTGTFKLLKVDLQKDGFDISRIKDALYFLRDGKYSPLDKTLYEDVISGRLRL